MSDFAAIQREFVAHIRDPQAQPFGHDIEDRRLAIYRDLLFNNIKSFISSGFPVLCSLYSDADWQALVRQFFANHACRSPYFSDISLEFVEYLSREHQPQSHEPPFLAELAHYEWLELDVSIRKLAEPIEYWDGQQGFDGVRMSPLASLVSYHYPVHQIGPQFQPQSPGEPIYLVVYRDSEDEVNFSLLNPVSAHLVNILEQQGPCSVSQLCDIMQQALPQLPAVQLREFLLQALQQMLAEQILLVAN